MKKNIKLLIITIVFAFALSLMGTVVKAGTVTTLEVTEGTNGIKVTGTTEGDVHAVAIEVYNEAGTEFNKMKTTEVNDSNEYSDTITIANGTYLVKVADYAGGDYLTKTITIGNSEATNDIATEEKDKEPTEEPTDTENEEETSSNPKTGDIIITFFVIFAVSTLGFVITKIIKKRA